MNQTNLSEGAEQWFEGIKYRLHSVYSDTNYQWEPVLDNVEVVYVEVPTTPSPPNITTSSPRNNNQSRFIRSSDGNQVRLTSGTVTR